MKKLHSLFILSILALTMFVGCQMPTDSVETTDTFNVSVNKDARTLVTVSSETSKALETIYVTATIPKDYTKDDVIISVANLSTELKSVDTDETDKIVKSFIMPSNDVEVFVDLDDYYIYYDGKLFKNILYPKSMIDEIWIKGCNLLKDTDYTWGDRTFNVTKIGVQKILDTLIETPTDDNGNGEAEDPVDDTPTDTTPTDDTSNEDGTPIVADFVDTTDYNVYKDGNPLATIKGKILNAICKKEGFVKDTDYTIEGDKVNVITGSRLYDWLTPQNIGGLVSDDEGGNDNGGSGTETTTETYKVIHGNDTGTYSLVFDNYKKDGYTKGETVKFLITNGNFDVNSGWGTPEGLYLVKVHIISGETELTDIPVTVTKDHKIQFTMPDKDVMVRADFEDVVCRAVDVEAGDSDYIPNWFSVTTSNADTVFQVALRFDTKEYDNLEEFNGIFKFKLCNLRDIYDNPEDWKAWSNYHYYFYIQLGNYYNVYDYKNPENCKYHENPVIIYNGTMCEPEISEGVGSRYINLDSQN